MPADYVLYVDDQTENLDGFMFTFRKDFRILTADSAVKGMELLAKHPIKVILTDQRMPDITGVEFLEKVLPLYPNIVRILVTGFADIEATIQAVNKGKIYHYVTKPWKSEELKMVIQNAISYHDLKNQNRQLLDTLTQQNEALKIAKENAEQSERLKTSFLANLSHEIRTPMNGIIGYAALLLDEENSDEERSDYLKTIKRNTYLLLQIVTNVLDMALLETGQLHFAQLHFDIYPFVNKVLEDFCNETFFEDRQDISIVNRIDSQQSLTVVSDKARLAMVITNLLHNAVKFTSEGEIGIDIQASNRDGFIEIAVHDTGIGIPEDKFEYIFGRFNKIENTNIFYDGLGLGLTLANEITKNLHGYIRLTSSEGKGSTFYVGIPLVAHV